jgi:V/A-type H+-transporting ATPase subunit A
MEWAIMTTNTGRIESIAGPVVKAAGLPSVRMYEVVKVGDEGLIGEVIEVSEDVATIQVYEETSGLAPEESVVPTGNALSVELGPGLLGAIYDGIQRPLPTLRDMSGDFISRGLSAPSLDRTKQWNFKPVVQKGDHVIPGDILGEVPETGIITSKILVPVGIEGEITDIVSEGKYTIVDPLCTVKDRRGDFHEIIMIQRTAVRRSRPFIERVELSEPLITGQRVIDTFMPQAKGGTGGIPGGFGTGKCVTGDTPVYLANGNSVEINRLFEQALQHNGRVIEDSEDDMLIEFETPLAVLSFDGHRYVTQEATHVYKGKTDILVEITTRTGRKVQITPIHKLFRFNGESIEEIEARHLQVGDHLVVPRKMHVEGTHSKFDPYEVDPALRAVDEDSIHSMIETIRSLKERMTLKELAKHLQVSYDVLIGYWLKKNNPTLAFLRVLTKFANQLQIPVKLVKSETNSEPFGIPHKLTKELAEWLGLFVADGHIRGNKKGVYLYNTSEQILDRFAELTRLIFNTEVRFGHDSPERTPYAFIRNVTLIRFLYYLGIPKQKKTHQVRVPQCIRTAPDDIITHFLCGYFAGDGHFSRYTVEFTTVSKRLYSDISYLLTRLGILYSARKKKTAYRLSMDGIQAELLAEHFLAYSTYPYDKLKPLYQYAISEAKHFVGLDVVPLGTQILSVLDDQRKDAQGVDIFRQTDGIRIHNYSNLGETPSRQMLERIVEVIKTTDNEIQDSTRDQLESILSSTDHCYFDRIVEIKFKEQSTPVYDITVPDTHNFVGGVLPFTLHNTITLHQFAKWADAQVVVYVGCGERGNEMTEALEEWPHLKDPKTNRPLMERTILIANTSNMPVAAREASIYVAITIAEYFRDQGFDVALMADSTSRWAEALREISGRLGQLPSEEGYPAYLGSRLAQFYERSGRVKTLGSDERIGSITVCGAVSPPGGDFSEPVTQATLRIVKVFWALDKDLAARRFFPAINTLTSYSLYQKNLEKWHKENLGPDWPELVTKAMALLQKDQELREIVQLVGPDALPESERAILEAARMIKEDFLTQSALHEIDTYCPIGKTYRMLRIIIRFVEKMAASVKMGVSVRRILEFSVLDNMARMKITPWDGYEKTMDAIEKKMDHEFQSLYNELAESGLLFPGVLP